MPSGGPREAQSGAVYSNRSDLSGSSSGDATYGDGVNKAAVTSATPGSPTASRPRTTQAPPPPGSFGSLTAPTSRPDEPVTAGITRGMGAGPEALGQIAPHNEALWELRALAQRFPDDRDLLRIIAMAEERQ